MKIQKGVGNKVKGDETIKIKTDGWEQLDMIEVGNLINQFALNEFLIIDEKEYLNRKEHNWFPNVLLKSFTDAEKGIEWEVCDKKNIESMIEKPFCIPKESINKFLEGRNHED